MNIHEGVRVVLKNGNMIMSHHTDGRGLTSNKGLVTMYINENEMYVKLDKIGTIIKTKLTDWELEVK